ncbi:hypothetical protein Tco_0730674, partial [Tanacetum coccineum]
APQDLARPIFDEAMREYCDKNYHQILPIIAEKVHQEKVQQEKLKAIKARLNFEEASRHSESGTPSGRRSFKERLGPRHAHSIFEIPEPRHAAETWKAATKVLTPGKQKLLPRNIVAKEHPRKERKHCQKVKAAQEDIGSQNQRSKSRELRTTCPNHGVWFDDLPQESIDSYDDLRKAYLENYLQQKKYIKDRFKSTTSSKGTGNPQKNSCGGLPSSTQTPPLLYRTLSSKSLLSHHLESLPYPSCSSLPLRSPLKLPLSPLLPLISLTLSSLLVSSLHPAIPSSAIRISIKLFDLLPSVPISPLHQSHLFSSSSSIYHSLNSLSRQQGAEMLLSPSAVHLSTSLSHPSHLSLGSDIGNQSSLVSSSFILSV